ncbi:hypothetical protein J3459_016415 [Metarhizium acridum]|nr:hypothetical protein J3459_016415 [Metarhizium acridum]
MLQTHDTESHNVQSLKSCDWMRNCYLTGPLPVRLCVDLHKAEAGQGLTQTGVWLIPLIKRHYRYQRAIMYFSYAWALCIAGIVLTSFCSTVETLILAQGVAYGVAFLIFYYSVASMVNEL